MRRFVANWLHHLADRVGGVDFQARRARDALANEALLKISSRADDMLARAEKERDARSKLGLLDARPPSHWQSVYYTRQGFRVDHSGGTSQDHWRGGEPLHEGAVCPTCRKPLLLFWDINVRDPLLSDESPDLFGGLDRLPLYYCCRRPEAIAYQLMPSGEIKVFEPDLCAEEESPFSGYPDAFDRAPIRLDPIPRNVEILQVIANEFDANWLTSDETSTLCSYLNDNNDAEFFRSSRFSQFGGALRFHQGHRSIPCPNKHCETHRMGNPMFPRPLDTQMKELAVIDVDSGFEMDAQWAQIVFHICWRCLSIHGSYRIS